jgi:hypothetical protein
MGQTKGYNGIENVVLKTYNVIVIPKSFPLEDIIVSPTWIPQDSIHVLIHL